MAEIGLVASVIQVAGAGLKLSQTLYEYADSVNSADRRVKDIAKEVQLTSFVIDELANIFKNDESSNLLSENAIKTADETVRECSSVFTELDAALMKTKKSALGKFKFPFRETKIELLRNQIDKLKSTLQLLMQVLTLAHQKASQKLDREAEAAQREQIKALLQSKKDSTKRYEESLRNHKFSDDEESDQENEAPASISDSVTIASVKSSVTVDTLATCVQHVRSLLEDIESLQKALSNDAEGKDSSEHHQSLIGSYFRARGHLDSILLGNPDDRRSSMTSSINKSEVAIGITKTLSGTTLQGAESRSSTEVVVQSAWDSSSSLRPILTEAEFQKAILEAQEKARKEEREKLQLEARNRAEKEELAARKEAEEKGRKEMELKRKDIEKELESAKRKAQEELKVAKMAAIEAEARAAKEAAEREDRAKSPLKLTDAVGRKFNLPFHLCKTWQDFHKLMTQAFLPIDNTKSLVSEGRYWIYGPEGEVIMPECWDSVIQAGWTITMKLWDAANPAPSKSVNDTMALLPQSVRPKPPAEPANPSAAQPVLPKLTAEEKEVYQAPYFESVSDISDSSVLTVSNPWNPFAPTEEVNQLYNPFAPPAQSNKKETDGSDENLRHLRTDLIDDFPGKMASLGFNEETPVRDILQQYEKGRGIPLSDFGYVAWICYEVPKTTEKRANWQERILRPSDAALTVYHDLEKKGYKPRFAITNGTPTKLECYSTLRRVIRKEILVNREQRRKEGLSDSAYAELKTRRMELRRMEDGIYEAWREESRLQHEKKNEKLEIVKTKTVKTGAERRPTPKMEYHSTYDPTLYRSQTKPQRYPSAPAPYQYGTYPSRPPPSLPAYSHLPPALPPPRPRSYDAYASAPSSVYEPSSSLSYSVSPRPQMFTTSVPSPPHRQMAAEPPSIYTSPSPPLQPSGSAIIPPPQRAPDPLFSRATALPPQDRYSRPPFNRRQSLILSLLQPRSSRRPDSMDADPAGTPGVTSKTTASASKHFPASSPGLLPPSTSALPPEQAQNTQNSPFLHWNGRAPKETHKAGLDDEWDYTVPKRRTRPQGSRTYGAEEPWSLDRDYLNIDSEREKRDEGDGKSSKEEDDSGSRERVRKAESGSMPSTKPVVTPGKSISPLQQTATIPSPPARGPHTEPSTTLERERSPYTSRPNTFDTSDDEAEPLALPIERERKPYAAAQLGKVKPVYDDALNDWLLPSPPLPSTPTPEAPKQEPQRVNQRTSIFTPIDDSRSMLADMEYWDKFGTTKKAGKDEEEEEPENGAGGTQHVSTKPAGELINMVSRRPWLSVKIEDEEPGSPHSAGAPSPQSGPLVEPGIVLDDFDAEDADEPAERRKKSRVLRGEIDEELDDADLVLLYDDDSARGRSTSVGPSTAPKHQATPDGLGEGPATAPDSALADKRKVREEMEEQLKQLTLERDLEMMALLREMEEERRRSEAQLLEYNRMSMKTKVVSKELQELMDREKRDFQESIEKLRLSEQALPDKGETAARVAEEEEKKEGEGEGKPSSTDPFVSPDRKVDKKQRISLADFINDSGSATGSWADEMEELPVAPARRGPSARDYADFQLRDGKLDTEPRRVGRDRRGSTARRGESRTSESKVKPWEKPWRSVDESKEDTKGSSDKPLMGETVGVATEPEGKKQEIERTARALEESRDREEKAREDDARRRLRWLRFNDESSALVVRGDSDSHAAEVRGEDGGDEVDELLREWTTVAL